METKRVKVIMLPARSGENLILRKGNNNSLEFEKRYMTADYLAEMNYTPYHLYFLSDEEIKKGDRYLKDGEVKLWQGAMPEYYKLNGKKIIVSTDKSLVLYNESDYIKSSPYAKYLPQPSQAFLEKYCKLGGIDEVLVEYDLSNNDIFCDRWKLKVDSHNTVTIHPIKDNWNRSEMTEMSRKLLYDAIQASYFKIPSFREKSEFQANWLKENLK